MESVYRVRTPENVVFEFATAGPAARACAWGLDRVLVVMATVAAGVALSLVEAVAAGLGSALFLVVYFTLDWGYHVAMEWRSAGRTVGKRIMGLRVMSDRGLRITFGQAVLRNLLRAVDGLPILYLLGGGLALVEPYGRRLGDLAAGTLVVRVGRRPLPAAVMPANAPQNPWLNDAEATRRIHHRITVDEREAIVTLALRREELDLPVRLRLMAEASAHLEGRLGLPRPDSLSHENYTLNVAAILLGAGKA